MAFLNTVFINYNLPLFENCSHFSYFDLFNPSLVLAFLKLGIFFQRLQYLKLNKSFG